MQTIRCLRGNAPRKVMPVVALLLGSAISLVAGAQELDQMKTFGQYHVFYNLINSTFLEPEVAERYDLPREEDVAILTISVRGPNEEGVMTDQPAQVSGEATDLVYSYGLEFEEFRDPQAVYYLAEVPADGRTELDFSLDIKPRDSTEVYELEFSQTLYPPAPKNR